MQHTDWVVREVILSGIVSEFPHGYAVGSSVKALKILAPGDYQHMSNLA